MRISPFLFLAGMILCLPPARLGAETPGPGTVLTLVAFGDSTTAARGSLRVYPDLLAKALSAKGLNTKVINAGKPGDTTGTARFRFRKDVVKQRPDIAVIQFGINDSTIDVWRDPPATKHRIGIHYYTGMLDYFVETLQEQKCTVILMTPNPLRWTPELKKRYGKPPYQPDDPDGFNTSLAPYAESVRELAKKRKVPLIDVYAAFQAHGKVEGKSVDELLLDGMHPNDRGHRLIANLLVAQILEAHPAKRAAP